MNDTAPGAYFVPLEPLPDGTARFRPTGHTLSTWSGDMQHGSPPSALLVHALRRHQARPDTRLTRVVVEILGPVPLTEIRVRAWTERPGRRIELVVAELSAEGPDGSWRAVARGTGWRLQTADTAAIAHAADPAIPPRTADPSPLPDNSFWHTGFIDSVDWNWLTPLGASGLSHAWGRPTPVLVEGLPLDPIERLFLIADTANGVGSKLDPAAWTFLNTDVTVHLFRIPDGDWIGVSAETSYGPDGVAMSSGVLHDDAGPVARVTQTVQVRAR
ncbi:thioesterase family protein [Rhodococcus sp. NPDC058532]|uniref:thioesterase family protein n=1 Tax=Rhodococcus sp. NPDC058532 TaxID=3346540 RepID=UPI00365EDD67